MTFVTRRIEWDAAHRVMRHESKCSTLHGHRYVALITLYAGRLDDCDRVVDFGVVKELVGQWVDDHWDHTTLVNGEDAALVTFTLTEHTQGGKRPPYVFRGEPTAENIARELLVVARDLLSGVEGVVVHSVEVFETPNCSATVNDVGVVE